MRIWGKMLNWINNGQRISLVKTFSVLLLFFNSFSLMVAFYSGFTFLQKTSNEAKKERIVQVQQKLNEVESDLKNYHIQLKNIYLKMVQDEGLSSNDALEKLIAKRKLHEDFESCVKQYSAINGFFYYDEDRNINISYNNLPVSEKSAFNKLIESNALEASKFPNTGWRYVESDGYQYLYIVYKSKNSRMGALIGLDELLEDCEKLILTKGELFVVYRQDEAVIMEGNESEASLNILMDNLIYEHELANTDIRFSYYYRPFINLKLLDTTVINSFLFILLELAFFTYSYWFMKKYLIKPFNSITGVMKEVEAGDYQVRVDLSVANSIEVLQLSKTLNHMLDEVVNLRMESYERILREQNVRLCMLRSKLRPHTYLNALNTINSMTYKEHNEERIREYLYVLSIHMRFMMKLDVSTVTLMDELKNIEAYIKLQEFRSERTYNYHLDIDESLMQIQIPYLLLYTLIDNVFKHGIKTPESFFVIISCQKGTLEDGTPVAVLSVEDNGNGFPEDYLLMFEQRKIKQTEDGHIGLYNIMQTLELMYGRQDLIKIENTITGARVEVRIIDESVNSR